MSMDSVMQRIEDVTETLAAVKGEDYMHLIRYALVIGMNFNFSVRAGVNEEIAKGVFLSLNKLLIEHAAGLGIDLSEETLRAEFNKDLTTLLRAFNS